LSLSGEIEKHLLGPQKKGEGKELNNEITEQSESGTSKEPSDKRGNVEQLRDRLNDRSLKTKTSQPFASQLLASLKNNESLHGKHHSDKQLDLQTPQKIRQDSPMTSLDGSVSKESQKMGAKHDGKSKPSRSKQSSFFYTAA